MKELTIEQKAKAYDEALERAREWSETKNGYYTPKELCEEIFPELHESEDEKTRKAIISGMTALKDQGRETFASVPINDCIAWLERQGEQIDIANKEYWRGYREGKKLILDKYAETEKQNGQDILEDAILYGNEDGLIAETIRYKYEKQGRQNHTQEIEPFEAEHGKYYYCIKDYFCGGRKQASKGDVIQALRGLPIMGLKDASEYFLPVNFIKCNSAWGEEDEHRIKDTVYFLDTAKKHYASTEELDACIDWIQSLKDRVQLKQEWNEEDEIDKEILNAAILFAMNSTDEFACNGVSKEDVIDWLKSFKDRVQSQPKQEWSEEDSYYRNHIIQIIEEINNAPLKRGEDWEAYINWLKSLRPQNQWKPSDEQMMALLYHCSNGSVLSSLYNDLNKLKEE